MFFTPQVTFLFGGTFFRREAFNFLELLNLILVLERTLLEQRSLWSTLDSKVMILLKVFIDFVCSLAMEIVFRLSLAVPFMMPLLELQRVVRRRMFFLRQCVSFIEVMLNKNKFINETPLYYLLIHIQSVVKNIQNWLQSQKNGSVGLDHLFGFFSRDLGRVNVLENVILQVIQYGQSIKEIKTQEKRDQRIITLLKVNLLRIIQQQRNSLARVNFRNERLLIINIKMLKYDSSQLQYQKLTQRVRSQFLECFPCLILVASCSTNMKIYMICLKSLIFLKPASEPGKTTASYEKKRGRMRF